LKLQWFGVRYEFWRHPSAGVYAVELFYGQLGGCCRVPIEDADLDVLPFLPYDKGDTFQRVVSTVRSSRPPHDGRPTSWLAGAKPMPMLGEMVEEGL
jgi:hypothetical protein